MAVKTTKSVIVVLSLIPSLVLWTSTCFSTQNKDDQIKQIETDLSREKQQFQKFNLKERNLLDQLTSIEKKLQKKRNIIREISENLNENRQKLVEIEKRLKDHETALTKMQGQLERRLVSYYKYSRRGYMQVLTTTEGLDELRRRMKYLHFVMREDQKMIALLAQEKLKYGQTMLGQKKQLKVIMEMEAEEKKELQDLEEELEKKVIIISRIHKEKEFYETAVKELQAAAEGLKTTILTIEKRKSRAKGLPTDFSSYQGKLPLPINGKVIRKKNPLEEEGVYTHRGIYISGPLGGEIRSVFDGRVDFSGWIKGYGQVLVINHGSRFYSILAHLMERNKEDGDNVKKGEVVGLLGQSGSFTGPALYFELRNGSTTLDPEKWLKDH